MSYTNLKSNTSNSEWTQKYLREYPFMPFGSMINAWSVLHQGQNISLEEFIKVVESIYEVSKKLVNNRMKETETSEMKDDNPDFDIMNQKNENR